MPYYARRKRGPPRRRATGFRKSTLSSGRRLYRLSRSGHSGRGAAVPFVHNRAAGRGPQQPRHAGFVYNRAAARSGADRPVAMAVDRVMSSAAGRQVAVGIATGFGIPEPVAAAVYSVAQRVAASAAKPRKVKSTGHRDKYVAATPRRARSRSPTPRRRLEF